MTFTNPPGGSTWLAAGSVLPAEARILRAEAAFRDAPAAHPAFLL